MQQLWAIALGGAAGALLRFGVTSGATVFFGKTYPFGTLLVNVSGAFCIGFLSVWLKKQGLSSVWHAGLITGVLGAYTTFSAFSIETVSMLESGEWVSAVIYVVLSVLVCLASAWFGLIAARHLFS